jgi:ABC-type branched-subunit amino acid transport system ATPase component
MWPILAIDLSATLGISRAWSLVLAVLVGLPVGVSLALRLSKKDRATAVTVGVMGGSVAMAVAGLAGSLWELVAGAVLAGVSLGVAATTHLPLLADLHPARRRSWAFGQYGAVSMAAAAGGVVPLGLAAGSEGLTWRGALLICAGVTVLVAGLTRMVHDTGRGDIDVARMAKRLRGQAGSEGLETRSEPVSKASLSHREQIRRVLAIPSGRPLLNLSGVCGVVYVAMPTYLVALVEQRFAVTPERASLLVAVTFLVGAVAAQVLTSWLLWGGGRTLGATMRIAAGAAGVSALALFLTGASPALLISVLLLSVAAAGTVLALASGAAVLLTVTPDEARGLVSALLVSSALVGGVLERELMDSVAARFGVGWALFVVGAAIIAVADWTRRAASTVDQDLDTVMGQIIEQVDVEIARSHGLTVPLLACRNLDFSYGQLQVLFDVTLSVREGEMVALLGTNGAGKSTLLKAISGIGFPLRGSIIYGGSDITYVPADRRVRLGISQLPGGRAVFGPLSVLDNLRVFGYSRGRSHREIEAGIEASFDAFPQLAARRHMLASTLSGGQQQMLALTRALLLRPRLLLIDELSLGLAPIVVGQLLEMVRRINAEGTSIVLVEQSVNIALSLVDHAYFMERGSIRFDGSAQELLSRGDLIRSVFLEGALAYQTDPTSELDGP